MRPEFWRILLRGWDPSEFDLDALAEASAGFSGAEIEQAVISALYEGFSQNEHPLSNELILNALSVSVPLSVSMAEQIASLREWASDRCRFASTREGEDAPELEATRTRDGLGKRVVELGDD